MAKEVGHFQEIGFAQVLDGIFFFNPGYAGKPKFGATRSVAILQVEEKEIRHEFIAL